MIIGIGVDIIKITRIENILAKYNKVFLNKIYHYLEIREYNLLAKHKQVDFLSKRFAAKEAVAKALGTGISGSLSFKDIAIINDIRGAPKVILAKSKLSYYKDYRIHISMSDDYPLAIAFVVISK